MNFSSHIFTRTSRTILVIFIATINPGTTDSVIADTQNNSLIIDDRTSGSLNSNLGTRWRLVTDNVMGGISSGKLTLDNIRDKNCIRMQGDVSTENNGGFVQIILPLSDKNSDDKAFDASAYKGIEIEASGNDESYNVHFRTDQLWFPWQSYRYSFKATPDWQTYRIPFSKLEPYKTTTKFSQDKIIRIGLVAIGREFQANLCIASINFYTE
jgi:hypothetical protein